MVGPIVTHTFTALVALEDDKPLLVECLFYILTAISDVEVFSIFCEIISLGADGIQVTLSVRITCRSLQDFDCGVYVMWFNQVPPCQGHVKDNSRNNI